MTQKERIGPSISTMGFSTLIFSKVMAAKKRELREPGASRKAKPAAPRKTPRRRGATRGAGTEEGARHGRRGRRKGSERGCAREVIAVQGGRSMGHIATARRDAGLAAGCSRATGQAVGSLGFQLLCARLRARPAPWRAPAAAPRPRLPSSRGRGPAPSHRLPHSCGPVSFAPTVPPGRRCARPCPRGRPRRVRCEVPCPLPSCACPARGLVAVLACSFFPFRPPPHVRFRVSAS